ncbi:MAG: SfiI family type II restriction endonuclease [Candidatus Acidiferrales bacterium]
MFIDPNTLSEKHEIVESIEKSSLRFVTQAIELYKKNAIQIFQEGQDWQADIGEDITAEALDSLGMSRTAQRVFGKMDYKRARYIFEPEYAIRQVLLVDSKVEKEQRVARVQVSQTSMHIRQVRRGQEVDIPGAVPRVASVGGVPFLTTTIFVKYIYSPSTERGNELKVVKTACVPNGFLQERYNPTARDTIWMAGPNAPTRGEAFRARLHFARLKQKCAWRVQTIPIEPAVAFVWDN